MLCSASKPSESAAAKALAKVAGTAGAVTLALALGSASPAFAVCQASLLRTTHIVDINFVKPVRALLFMACKVERKLR